MAACLRPALDAPIFSALKPLLGRLPRVRFPRHDELNALGTRSMVSGGGAPIRFVPPAASAQYEVRIFETGEVQTRPDNWHDLFNALVWLAFPKTKAVLNRHHYEQIKARLGEHLRGTVRDVLTLFDEGGIVVAAADPELPALLREFRWRELFWRRRAEVLRSMRFYVFGHAIYEKALEPYKGVTAKALILDVAPGLLDAPIERQLSELDLRAADYFSGTQALSSTRKLSPLPILGRPSRFICSEPKWMTGAGGNMKKWTGDAPLVAAPDRQIACRMIAASVMPSPAPPYCSGMIVPSQPRSAKARTKSQGYCSLRSCSSQYSGEKLVASASTSS